MHSRKHDKGNNIVPDVEKKLKKLLMPIEITYACVQKDMVYVCAQTPICIARNIERT